MGIAIFIVMPIPIIFTIKIFCGHIMVWISLTLSICRHNCFHAIIFWDVSPTRFQPRGPKMPNMMFSLFYVEQLFFNQYDDFFMSPPLSGRDILSYLRVYPWAWRLYHPEALLYSLRQSRRLYSGAEGWYNLNAHG